MRGAKLEISIAVNHNLRHSHKYEHEAHPLVYIRHFSGLGRTIMGTVSLIILIRVAEVLCSSTVFGLFCVANMHAPTWLAFVSYGFRTDFTYGLVRHRTGP